MMIALMVALTPGVSADEEEIRTRISVEKSKLLQTNWLPPQVACVEAEVCMQSGHPRFIHYFPTHNTAAATQAKEANGKGRLSAMCENIWSWWGT